jgi:hydroxycarboxylate dehydrogenase B
VDCAGQPTTDPGVLYADPRGSILPFGGAQMYKGFGLGLLLDLLCGGLSGGPCSSPAFPIAGQGNTAVFVVFDTAHFGGTAHFVEQSDGLTEYVRSCPRADGVAAITLPGDPERTAKADRSAHGIAIPDGTWELIVKTATDLGVALTA